LLLLVLAAAAMAAPKPLPYRWVYVVRNLRSDRELEEIREIARTAAEHGLNGLVLSAGLDRLEKQPPDYLERVRKVKEICAQYRLELIPQIFSAGYGGNVLAFDKNLAEGIPVQAAPFVVKGGEARVEADPELRLVNGDLEEYTENRARGFQLQEQPGTVTFVDTSVTHHGKASLRFENFTANQYGHGRLMQEIAVRPHRLYRFTCWVKTDLLAPADKFAIQVLDTKGRSMAPLSFHLPATADWRKLQVGFNSLDAERVRVYAGIWGGKSGRFWIDELSIEEIGLSNVLRRPGTPVTVRDGGGETVFVEGRDYARIQDPVLDFRFERDGPPIRVLPEGRIREGQKLLVDYYHGMSINNGQVTVCMSEPKLYQIWREQARRLHELLAPEKYLLSMDEIRAGGSDAACKDRHMTMGEILGDCFTKQFQMLRALNPKAEVWTWSDMLDPNHNAHGGYYLVDGDYTGSWQHIPREMRIMCWYFEKRRPSLEFFSRLGFVTAAGAYYDGDTLDNPKGWLEALDGTPGAAGIMYTTWQNKYGLLAGFGDLMGR
jgi:hypothetical protein